tara:strand:+ start:1432 stop:2670 length:1239 start_codon:yes stop_codon:yes gene_type:complete
MPIYKNIVIGSGPIGFHVFKKISNNSILITGETKNKISSSKIHPKVRVCLKKKTNKFSDLIYSKKNDFSIYSSSEIGGLTNYWGGQFFNYTENDNWPKKIFQKFSLYKKHLKLIDKTYPSLQSKNLVKKTIKNLCVNSFSPPLINYTIVKKTNLEKNYKKKLIHDRVIYFKKIKKNLIEVVTIKKKFYCKNLILCAGPIGNALILLRSISSIKSLKFNDDNPRLIFGLKWYTKKNLILKNRKLFDTEISERKKTIIYGTIFSFNPEHFNSFFKPVINLVKNILDKIFFYGIFWVNGEYNQITISLKNDKIKLSGNKINFIKDKLDMISNLIKINLKVLKVWNLRYAYGFHYHNLQVNYKNKFISLNTFLKKMKLKKNIYCFDSSVIDKIGNKPPTKTYLATANYLVEKIINH